MSTNINWYRCINKYPIRSLVVRICYCEKTPNVKCNDWHIEEKLLTGLCSFKVYKYAWLAIFFSFRVASISFLNFKLWTGKNIKRTNKLNNTLFLFYLGYVLQFCLWLISSYFLNLSFYTPVLRLKWTQPSLELTKNMRDMLAS